MRPGQQAWALLCPLSCAVRAVATKFYSTNVTSHFPDLNDSSPRQTRVTGITLPGGSLNSIIGGSIVITFAGLVLVYAILMRAPAAGTFHDDGIYLVTAKALAEDRGYRIISIPSEPPQTKYPILFPWVLSLVWRVYPSFPANLVWLRLVPLAAMIGWLYLSWALLRRLGSSPLQTAVIVLLTAMSPWVAFLSTALMSEMLFGALLTGALLTITRICQGDGRRFEPLLAGLLTGAAILTRVAGIAPAVAGVVVFLWSRRSVAAAQYLLGVLVTAVPWFWWAHYQNPIATSVDPYYSATNYASWNVVTSYAWAEKMDVLAMNAMRGGLALVQLSGAYVPNSMLGLAVAIAAAAILSRGLWHARREPATIVTVAYCGMHLLWVWPPLRFAAPLAPLLLRFGALGLGRSRRLLVAAALVLLGLSGIQLGAHAMQALEKGTSWPGTGAEDWNQTARLLSWVSRETPSDTVITGNLDPAYYLFTNRKAVRAFAADPLLLYYNLRNRPENPLGTVDEFRSRLTATKADYLILTTGGGFSEIVHLDRLVSELSQKCPGSLAPVATDVVPAHVIYRIDRRRLERHDGCRRDVRSEVN